MDGILYLAENCGKPAEERKDLNESPLSLSHATYFPLLYSRSYSYHLLHTNRWRPNGERKRAEKRKTAVVVVIEL